MNRTVAIVTLMTKHIPGYGLTPEETRERAECLIALGVTREELGLAKKRATQGEIEALRKKAAAREASLTAIVDWTPDIPEVPPVVIDEPAAPADPGVSPTKPAAKP